MLNKRYKNILPFLALILLTCPLLLISKEDSFLLINNFNSTFGDLFFKRITWLGEGLLICCCLICISFEKAKWVVVFILALLFHFLLIQINKQWLFNDIIRPLGYLRELNKQNLIHTIKGVRVHSLHSFPSGHTTGAAFAASFMAIILNNKNTSILLAIIAFLVGYSRVYLGQHFFIDIFFGLCFGTLSTVAAYALVQKNQYHYPWMHYYFVYIKSKSLKNHFFDLKRNLFKS